MIKTEVYSMKNILTQVISDLSAIQPLENPARRTMQVTGGVDSRLKVHDSVGKPFVHFSALQQSTGEAVYVDDMPPAGGKKCNKCSSFSY